jgi:hypothetical protein
VSKGIGIFTLIIIYIIEINSMGLDSVDIIIRIENAFDIKIADTDTEKVHTVSDLHSLVWKYVNQPSKNKYCLSQRLFYKVRNELGVMFSLSPREITPQTVLEDIIPTPNRNRNWQHLSNEISVELPELEFQSFLQNMTGTLLLIRGLGILIFLISLYWFNTYTFSILGIVLSAFFLNKLIHTIFKRRKTRFPQQNMRELVERIMEKNFKYYKDEELIISRKEVEVIVNNVISDVGGLDLKEISPEKSMVNDLGIN